MPARRLERRPEVKLPVNAVGTRIARPAGASALLAALIVVSSCSMRQDVAIKSDGSGTAQFTVTLDKSLIAAAKDMSPSGDSGSSSGGVDLKQIRDAFEKNSNVKLLSLASSGPGNVSGTVSFNDIRAIFRDTGDSSAAPLVTLTQSGSSNTLTIHLTRQNFARVAALVGMQKNPLYQMFGPEQNAATTQEDLDQMMVYVLGDGGPAALKASSIDIVVTPNTTITGQTGGTLSRGSALFHIPLTTLLLLAKPLDYSVTFS
jgi:hypothetical protein